MPRHGPTPNAQCPTPNAQCPMADAQRRRSILNPNPNQVSPECYYGVPTNQETLDLLAGSWFFMAGGSNLWVTYQSLGNQAVPFAYAFDARQHGQSGPLAVPQLTSCASSGRLWAARHSQEEAQPLGSQPPPRVLEPAASKSAVDHSGPARQCHARLHRDDHGETGERPTGRLVPGPPARACHARLTIHLHLYLYLYLYLTGGRHVRAGPLQLPDDRCGELRLRWAGACVQERLRSHHLLLRTALDRRLRRDGEHAAGSRRLGGCAAHCVRASWVLVRDPILGHAGRRSPARPGRLLSRAPGRLPGGWRLLPGVGIVH